MKQQIWKRRYYLSAYWLNGDVGQGQKVKGQGHKVTHKKFTLLGALALVTLESKRPLIVVVEQWKLYSE